MADFEKVFEIRFDTSDAERGVRRIEKLGRRAEKQLKNINQMSKAAGVSLGGAASARSSKQIATNIGTVSDRALKMRAQMEKAFAAFEGGAAKTKKRVGAVATATDRARAASMRAAKAGDALDKIMKRAGRDGAAGMKKVERAVSATQKAVKKTDEQYARFMRRRGEREKAKALAKVERRIRGIGRSSKLATTSVSGLLAKMSLIVGMASKIRDIGREYLDFDARITTAAAKFSGLDKSMEPGREGFARLRKEVRAAARETEHSAGAVAGAVDFWAKAGKTAQQTKAVIPMTLDFASANTDAAGAALDMARAGDILSDTLGQFRMNADDPAIMMENVARVADVMSAAANSANFSADELFESFKQAGPVLTAVGSDIEQTSALLATMANAGIKGAMSGTQLKVAISALSAPAGGARDLLEELGVKIKDSRGDFRGLTTIIGELNEATKDMGTGERFEVFAKLIGRRAIPSFINLLAQGQDELDAMTKRLREAGGETQRLSEIIRSSAQKQMQRFWNKVTDLGFSIVEETKLFDKLGKAIDNVDWEYVSGVVSNEIVPALVKLGKIFVNVIIPGFQNAAEMLEQIFAPALWLAEKAFGKVSDGGEGLARVLGILATAWVLYRTKVIAATALDVARYFLSIAKGARGAAVAQGALTTATGKSTQALGTATKAAGGLNKALGAIGILVATWEIANIIQRQLIDPLYEAKLAAKGLTDEVEGDVESYKKRGLKGQGVDHLEKKLKNVSKKIKEEKKQLDLINAEQRSIGEPELKTTKKLDEYTMLKRAVEQRLVTAKQEERIKKYGPADEDDFRTKKYGAADEGDFYSIPQSGLVTEYEEDFSGRSRYFEDPEPLRVPVMLDPEPLNLDPIELETGFSEPEPMDIPAMFSGGPGVGDTMAELLKVQSQTAEEARQRHKELVDATLRAAPPEPGPREVTQNIEIGGHTLNIDAKGADAREVGKIVDKKLRESDRRISDALHDAARSEGATEF